jgi:hypothetical protein
MRLTIIAASLFFIVLALGRIADDLGRIADDLGRIADDLDRWNKSAPGGAQDGGEKP